jgi:hypothetical protein
VVAGLIDIDVFRGELLTLAKSVYPPLNLQAGSWMLTNGVVASLHDPLKRSVDMKPNYGYPKFFNCGLAIGIALISTVKLSAQSIDVDDSKSQVSNQSPIQIEIEVYHVVGELASNEKDHPKLSDEIHWFSIVSQEAVAKLRDQIDQDKTEKVHQLSITTNSGQTAELFSGIEVPLKVPKRTGHQDSESAQIGEKTRIMPRFNTANSAVDLEVCLSNSWYDANRFRTSRFNSGFRLKSGQSMVIIDESKQGRQRIVFITPKCLSE